VSDLQVRSARPEELDKIGELTLRAYLADGYFDNGAAASYQNHLADARARADEADLLVAVDTDDQLLGTVTIALPGTRFAEVSQPGEIEFRMLAVDPDARGRGVGNALIQAVFDRARELSIGKVVLCTQEKMSGPQRMYRRLGFRRVPDRDWDPLPDVQLIAFELTLP
jgi:ribosomal protein S18 acetylase RimI-like enzyme